MGNKPNSISLTGNEDLTTLVKKIIEGGFPVFYMYVTVLTIKYSIRAEALDYDIAKWEIDNMKSFIKDDNNHSSSRLLARKELFTVLLRLYDLDNELFNKIRKTYNEKYDKKESDWDIIEFYDKNRGCVHLIALFLIFFLYLFLMNYFVT